jgi:antirestriction protein
MSYLDLRELADSWADEIEELNERTGESASYGELADIESKYWELCDALGIDKTPDDLKRFGDDYEPTLIPERDFEEYAQELADDCGMIPDNLSWPLTCIDWERAARELAYDYSSVSFDGTDYYIRSV